MRPHYRKVLLILSAVAFVGVVWEFSGLQGEVFLISIDGKTLVARGAQVWVVRTNKDRNMSALFRLWLPHGDQLLRSLADLQRKLQRVHELGRQRRIDAEKEADAYDAISQLTLEAQQKYCTDVDMDTSLHVGSQGVWDTADRNGRFSIRLLPGDYIVGASGQAGANHALWVEEVQVYWRSYVRLVSPVCQYETK